MAYFSTWAAIICSIWLLFSKAEDTLKAETNNEISNWLRNLNPERRLANWPITFAKVFDSIFGKKHLSWRCLSRSFIASFVAVVIVTIFWLSIRPEELSSIFRFGIGKYLLITILANQVPDYVSLLETRYIINKMRNVDSIITIIWYLVIDFAVTIIIFLIGCIICFSLFLSIISHMPLHTFLSSIPDFVKFIYSNGVFLKSHENEITPGIWFYSTFFTSIWVWLYFLSGLIVKAGVFLGILAGRIRKIMDIDNKPLRSMGFVCISFVSIIFLLFFSIVRLGFCVVN